MKMQIPKPQLRLENGHLWEWKLGIYNKLPRCFLGAVKFENPIGCSEPLLFLSFPSMENTFEQILKVGVFQPQWLYLHCLPRTFSG